ncbi:hypothetical protein HYDPIDRAFT_24419 [Hydnomerulius pinastri MD-312]|nr:hypothetical protein HYDPIDRAFT_24419 [Hydnomerulius pinastri MD-312]
MSGTTAQDSAWKSREQGEEARYAREKEQAQLAAICARQEEESKKDAECSTGTAAAERDFEGGFGGQEDLEDRYATTSGEH